MAILKVWGVLTRRLSLLLSIGMCAVFLLQAIEVSADGSTLKPKVKSESYAFTGSACSIQSLKIKSIESPVVFPAAFLREQILEFTIATINGGCTYSKIENFSVGIRIAGEMHRVSKQVSMSNGNKQGDNLKLDFYIVSLENQQKSCKPAYISKAELGIGRQKFRSQFKARSLYFCGVKNTGLIVQRS